MPDPCMAFGSLASVPDSPPNEDRLAQFADGICCQGERAFESECHYAGFWEYGSFLVEEWVGDWYRFSTKTPCLLGILGRKRG